MSWYDDKSNLMDKTYDITVIDSGENLLFYDDPGKLKRILATFRKNEIIPEIVSGKYSLKFIYDRLLSYQLVDILLDEESILVIKPIIEDSLSC